MDECKPLAAGAAGHAAARRGRAVQVDPIKPTLKAPEIKLLQLEYGKPLSKFAFTIILRRYIVEVRNGGLDALFGADGRGLHLSTSQLNLGRF